MKMCAGDVLRGRVGGERGFIEYKKKKKEKERKEGSSR